MEAKTFWQYSLSKYGIDEVKEACLQLQDRFGYNVNLLLFCMFSDSLSVVLSQQSIANIRAKIDLSDSQLIAHRKRRKSAKERACAKAAMQEQESFYEALLKQELVLEAQQQEIIIAAFLQLSENEHSDSMASQGSSMVSYLKVVNQQSTIVAPQQQQFINVLRKHV